MVEHEEPSVRRISERVDDVALAHADATRHSVDGVAAARNRERRVAATDHPLARGRVELRRPAFPRDLDHVAERERPRPDDDRAGQAPPSSTVRVGGLEP